MACAETTATSAERTLEVAHEALLRSWARLREWLATARADMRLQRQLAQAAAEWRESGNDASFLLRGNRLSQIQPLAKGELVALSRDESQFLDASLHAVAAREQHERDRADRELNQARELAAEQQRAAANERRGNRRLRLLVLGLAGILVVSVWQGLQLKARSNDLAQQTERANQEAKSAGSLSEFWAQLFATADPNLSRGKGRDLTVVEVLDVGLGRVQSDLKDSPLAQARLLLTMGRSFRQLAAYDKAQLALDQAQVAIANAPNAPDTERIDLLLERGRLFADRLEFEAALNELRQAQSLQVSSNAPPLSRATTLNIIASIYNDQLKLGDAEPLLRETLQLRRKHGASQAEIAGSLNNLAFTLLQLGYPREARELFLEGAQLREKLQTEPSLDAALMRMNVGVADRDLGQFDSAAKQFAQTRISLTQLVGSQDGSTASHPTLAALLLHESAAQSLQGRYETALERMESAVAMMTTLSGGNVDAPGLLSHRRERGRLQLLLGRIDEAEKDLKFACGLVQERFGPKSMPWGNCQSRMGEVELAKGNRELAGTRLEEAIEILSTRDERDLRNGIELARALLLRIELDPARAAADRPRAFALLDSAKELARARQVLEKIK